MKPIMLIRHGEAEHLTGELTGAWTDTELTDLGRRQSRALASRLRRDLKGASCKLLCSDLKRAAHTAEILGEELGLEPVQAPELREINNGIATGMTKEEARRHFKEPTRPILDWQAYPGSETWRRFYHRVSRDMEALTQDADKPLIMVTHGGTIVQIINWWLRLDMETLAHLFFDTAPASVTVLYVNKLSDRTIERLNDTSHLQMEGLHEGKLLIER